MHTRVATLVGPAILGLLLSLIAGNFGYLALIGVLLLLGVALDTAVYPWLLKYQPPWMTGVIAVGEFGLLLVLAALLDLGIGFVAAFFFYWVAWLMATATRIAILPIASLTYLESAGEFRHTAWSIPASQATLPVLAATGPDQAAPGPVISSAASRQSQPLAHRPAPSAIQAVPDQLRSGGAAARSG